MNHFQRHISRVISCSLSNHYSFFKSTRCMTKEAKILRLASSRDHVNQGMERNFSPLSSSNPTSSALGSSRENCSPSSDNTLRNSLPQSIVYRTENIDKSPNDRKKYRLIELQNGLKALLISDCRRPDTAACTGTDNEKNVETALEAESSSSDSGSDSESSSGDESEAESEHSGKRKMEKSTEKLSAAALCIGTGSFSDPTEVPGLAHFLEHMVFMGSEKYPEENAYDVFIKKHGGYDNASTDCEKTVFQFDIRQKFFKEGLDRFAQFFIHPLLKETSVDREVSAVDSEFDQSLTSDYARKQQLMGSMAAEAHPMGKFMWGNSRTLKEEVGTECIYSQLKEFHRRAYSAHYMTLAVQAEENLDTLEEWVSEIFSPVPNNAMPKPTFDNHQEAFDPSKFHKLYKIVPVKRMNQIEISWSLPCQLQHYKSKPLGYLSFLVGHEGKGSILSYLKKRFWALELWGGTGDSGYEHNSTSALFSISITLTEEGFQNYQQVLTAVFEYLAMLRREGPQRRIFDEVQTIDNNEFQWQEECEPVENVESLCEDMQLYPPQLYLTGSHLLFHFEDKLIEECLSQLIPSRANIMILSKTFETDSICHLREKWYQTPYTVTDIESAWIEEWENINPGLDFHLPDVNEFLATDFSLKTVDIDVNSQHPGMILNNEQSRLWYKKDSKFNVPKAYINFHLISPIVGKSPQSAVLFELFLKLLQHNLTEITYPAESAQLWYDFVILDTGLVLKLGGFNHKLAKLFEVIVDHLSSFETSQEMFDIVRDQANRGYYNHFIQPNKLVKDVRLSILSQTYWTSVDKKSFIQQVTKDMLMTFVQEFKSKLFIEGFVTGNMQAEEAMKLEEYIWSKLKCSVLPRNTRPELRGIQLPKGENYCCVESFNQADVNSSVTNYYQIGPATIRTCSLNDLLNMSMEEPCFDILRTREQLGYSVWCTSHVTNSILGLSLNVGTQTSKFSLNDVDDKMESFLKEFDQHLSTMTEEEFNTQVNSLVGLKKKEESNLGEEADKHWGEIIVQDYVFDRMEREIEALSSVSKPELIEWFHSNILQTDSHKKLSIQVQGKTCEEGSADLHSSPPRPRRRHSSMSCHGIKISEHLALKGLQRQEEIDLGGLCELVYLPMGKVPAKNCILDIPTFKRQLPVYPVHKITS